MNCVTLARCTGPAVEVGGGVGAADVSDVEVLAEEEHQGEQGAEQQQQERREELGIHGWNGEQVRD